MAEKTLALALLTVLAAAPLQDTPKPTCSKCSASYIPSDEIQAYLKRVTTAVADQQVRAVDVGKSHVDIGVVFRGPIAGSPNVLIGTRAFMGIGGAFIMPATLSIITNVFPARERGRAIGVWAATAGVGAALGPITGGFLLQHFYWGSIFLVNLPIVGAGLLAGLFLIPNSKDPAPPRLDPIGALLSIAGLSTLLFAVIEAPNRGWGDAVTVACFIVAALLLAVFFAWELRIEHPMLDLSFFRNPRFSAASTAIMLTFFAMFGSLFVLTQYLQFVLGYDSLQTGVRLLAFAIPMMVVAPNSNRLVERFGTKYVVAAGMTLTTVGLLLLTGLARLHINMSLCFITIERLRSSTFVVAITVRVLE